MAAGGGGGGGAVAAMSVGSSSWLGAAASAKGLRLPDKSPAQRRSGRARQCVRVLAVKSGSSSSSSSPLPRQDVPAAPVTRVTTPLANTIPPPPRGYAALPPYAVPVAGAVVAILAVVALLRGKQGSRRKDDDERGEGGIGSIDELVDRGHLSEDRNLSEASSSVSPAVSASSMKSVLDVPPLSPDEVKAGRARRARTQYAQPVFVREGDPVPEGVDPAVVMEIPRDHPFFASAGAEMSTEEEEVLRQRLMARRPPRQRVKIEGDADSALSQASSERQRMVQDSISKKREKYSGLSDEERLNPKFEKPVYIDPPSEGGNNDVPNPRRAS